MRSENAQETWHSTPRSRTPPLFPRDSPFTGQDRTIHSGKSKGGGVCFMVNNKWCSDVEIISTGCSPDLEHLMIRCRPYYLPREFTSVVMTAVYVLPHADNNKAMDELFGVIDRTETSRLEAAFIDRDINTYTDAVIGYIGKCIDDVVSKSVKPNLKHGKTPTTQVIWRSTGSPGTHSWRAISSAKRQYRDKVESHYKGSNTRSMWAGLKTLTDYKKKISSAEVMSASLPDELNTFYARFESTSPAVEVQKAQEDHCPPVISRADVCRTLKRINTRKAPGPDGIPGRALKVCADQLADVFADIFNMSLLQSVVPTCFKETIIVPVPKKTKILSLNDYRHHLFHPGLTGPTSVCLQAQ
ncbi:hypothetical protein L3Q82_007816 [Scortum barcoo]|uniref:Uncharacterized protein n=1 Tax=Scortum barcoo TaxID=214431 RepID=A0ACB8WJH8_9TELE|nr:hypothetical protein L3Q82_007816 [Scortum barcoo]